MKLASFDIFDTALVRKCGQAECIFELLGRQLYPEDAIRREEFVIWRRHIGERVQKSTGKTDATLAELYENADFPPWSTTELMNAEMSVEVENLVANPVIRQKIEKWRSDGWKICFISDMYLPSAVLKKVLLRENCATEDDKIFVSCEHQARKDRGGLYDVVREKFHPIRWIHFGDNRRSDIRQAKKHGIKAELVESGYTSIEEKTIAHSHLYRGLYDLRCLAGLSRNARLQECDTPDARLAADFVASAYLPYVFHIAEYAQKNGIKHLYFLSRDGYILKQAMEVAFPEFEMRELFVSRNALMLPYLHDNFTQEAYLKIVDRNTLISRTVTHMLWQLGIDRKILETEYGISFAYEHITTKQDEQDFLSKLFDSAFTPVLKDKATQQHDLLIRYFAQEKLTEEKASLLVDVGWVGTSRLMINSVLKHTGYDEKEFMYFGVRGDVLPTCYGRYSSFFPEGELNTNSTILIENYYSQSPNPSVRCYQEQEGVIIPVWEKEPCVEESQSLQVNRRVIREMATELRKLAPSPESLYTWSKLSLEAIGNLEGDIDLTPLLAVGDFENTRFVKKFSLLEALHYLCGKRINAFDPGCAMLTFGEKLGKKVIHCHDFCSRIFYPLYKRICMWR